jgi:hypothetical protein
VDLPVPEDGGHFAKQCRQRWAALIKQVYEIDPLICPQCGGTMRIIAFIEKRQGNVLRKILEHCGLWEPPQPHSRDPPAAAVVHEMDLIYAPDPDFVPHPDF